MTTTTPASFRALNAISIKFLAENKHKFCGRNALPFRRSGCWIYRESQSDKSALTLLSARAGRPLGKWSRTLPSGSPKTRSILRCPVPMLASRRRLNLRRAGNSFFGRLRRIQPVYYIRRDNAIILLRSLTSLWHPRAYFPNTGFCAITPSAAGNRACPPSSSLRCRQRWTLAESSCSSGKRLQLRPLGRKRPH